MEIQEKSIGAIAIDFQMALPDRGKTSELDAARDASKIHIAACCMRFFGRTRQSLRKLRGIQFH